MSPQRGTFPFDALRPLIEQRVPADIASNGTTLRAGTAERVANVIGVTRRTVQRWQSGQLLNVWNADLVATRLGTHPSLVWPDWQLELDEAV